MIFCGATSNAYRRAAGSAFSIGRTMKRFSSCGCTKSFSSGRSCRLSASTSGTRGWPISPISRTISPRQGTIILKFFLYVSRQEQKKRFIERLDQPDKRWKFSAADIREREFWDGYVQAFEEAVRATASKHAPWFVVPADNKWFTRLVVMGAIVKALDGLDLAYPQIDPQKEKELAAARAALANKNNRFHASLEKAAPAEC